MAIRAGLYARTSPGPEKSGQFSIASQLRALREAARQAGHQTEEAREFTDEKISGTTLQRPGLERLRQLVREGALDAVWVHAVDRLSRNAVEAALLWDEFHEHQVELHFVRSYEGGEDADQIFVIERLLGQFEKTNLLERTARGKREMALQGFFPSAAVPFGYRYTPRNNGIPGRVAIFEAEATTVRQMFRWATDGMSLSQIAARLNRQGVLSARAGKPNSRTGKPSSGRWSTASVQQTLRNSAYMGRMIFRKRREDAVEIPFPPIVDPALFTAVQTQLEANRKIRVGRPSRQHLLCQILACDGCGTRMLTKTCYPLDPLYYCPHCPANRIPQLALDRGVWEALWHTLTRPPSLAGLAATYAAAKARELAPRRQLQEAALTRLHHRQERAIRILKDPDVPYDQATANLQQVRDEITTAEAALAQLALLNPPSPELLAEEMAAREPKTFEEQRRFLKLAVHQIRAAPGEARIELRWG